MPFLEALADAGGAAAPRERDAQLRDLLLAELRRGRGELTRPRSGYGAPLVVAVAAAAGAGGDRGPQEATPPSTLLAAAPVDAALRADPGAVPERAWLLTAAVVGALVDAAGLPAPRGPDDLRLLAGELDGALLLGLPSSGADPADADLAALAFEEHAQSIDRLRATAAAVPARLLEPAAATLRDPIGPDHPLRAAEALARVGARPADPASAAEHEDEVLALLEAAIGRDGKVPRPHDDPDPARRAARRILHRLAGMGKWGGYHTDVAHLSRGFAGNDKALAAEVGEALLEAGLLDSKPSVGQRHVFLNPRRAADIHALIERAVVPPDLRLPR